jgi:5-methylcytosine-specific restriction endonuclease McrA
MHYARMRRRGAVELPVRESRFCERPDCNGAFYGRGLCRRHYDKDRSDRWDGVKARQTPEDFRLRAKRRRAALRGATGDHTHAEWLVKLAAYGGICAYCDKLADTKDHVVAIAKGGTHDIGNIVPACRSCNSRKGTGTLRRDAGGRDGQTELQEAQEVEVQFVCDPKS